jgi:predicted dehydrogenase
MTSEGEGKVRVGLVGAGIWGTIHAKVYRSLQDAELVAIADRDLSKAEKLSTELGGNIELYRHHEELLADGRIDAISVAVPDFAHRDVILAAVRAGKHILVEKPFTTRVADAEECIREMKKSEGVYMVNFHLRWMMPFFKAHELIQSGAIGEPRFCHFEQSNSIKLPDGILPWSASSNALWFLGIHSVDMLQWLFGKRITHVFCMSDKKILKDREIDTEDFFASTLEFEGGAKAQLENSWILPESYPSLGTCRCTITGTKGCLSVDAINNRSLHYTQEGKASSDVNVFGFNTFDAGLQGSPVSSIGHFIRCVKSGNQPIVTMEDALSSVKIVTALLTSASERKLVRV